MVFNANEMVQVKTIAISDDINLPRTQSDKQREKVKIHDANCIHVSTCIAYKVNLYRTHFCSANFPTICSVGPISTRSHTSKL